MSTFEMTTERLILRHPTMDDAPAIAAAKQAVWPDLQRWMVWAHDGEETLESTKAFIPKLGQHCLVGFCRESGRLVLMCGLTPQERDDEYETGYWTVKEFLGKGYATEATCAATHFAFKELKAKKIHISHYAGNIKSRHIIEKLGFSNETVVPKMRKAIVGGDWQDSHRFLMTDPSSLPKIAYEWRGRW